MDGDSVKPLDLTVLQLLHKRVNLIPCIAKGDTLTREESIHFKQVVRQALQDNNIDVYQFPDMNDEDEDESTLQEDVSIFFICTLFPLCVCVYICI